MDILKKFTIPYKGLSIGDHDFEFEVNDRFFEAFEGSEIGKGTARAIIRLNKQNNLLTLTFDIQGEVMAPCDRCLEECPVPVDYQGQLFVRFSETERESDGEILWISPAETELALGQYIYESIVLGLPYQRVHATDVQGNSLCAPEMLKRFSIVSEDEFEELARAEGKPAGQKTGATGKKTESSPWSKLEALKTTLENEEK